MGDRTTSTRPVAGVWMRLWEADPLDCSDADRETLVLWTQTPESGIYVDLRLPLHSPGRSLEAAQVKGFKPRPSAIEATGFNFESGKAVDDDLVTVLLRQKSFAGVLRRELGDTTRGTALKKDPVLAELASSKNREGAVPLCTCYWVRDIDFQPPSGSLDVGVCASGPLQTDGSVEMRETGEDGTYAEGWQRVPNTYEGPFLALQLESENGKERKGYWVRAGVKFAYAIGRPNNSSLTQFLGCHPRSSQIQDCVGKSLSEATDMIASETQEDKLCLAGTYVAVAGDILEDGTWQILFSTHPELIGCALVGGNDKALCCSSLRDYSQDYLKVGCSIEQILAGAGGTVRRWRLVEIDGCRDLPGLVG